jgi:hypothetical protein
MLESGRPRLAAVTPTAYPSWSRFSRGLLQPENHARFAIHRHRDSEVGLSLTGMAHAVMHFAETEVAVGNKRAHAARLGERQRVAVVAFSVLGAGCGGDVTVETEGMALVSPGPQPPGERYGRSGVVGRFIDPPE